MRIRDPGSGMETVRIRDPGWKKVGSEIRDKHPGSATLTARSKISLHERKNSCVADPGWISRILIFIHPETRIHKRGGEICWPTFFVGFWRGKEKIWTNSQIFLVLFSQEIVTKLSEIWVRDPGSEKNLFRIPGSTRHRIPDHGSRSATLAMTDKRKHISVIWRT